MDVSAIAQRLRGKHALVTGGSSGIGRAVAVRYAREGATVAINYVGSSAAAEETLELARRATGDSSSAQPKHCIVKADVADEAEVLAMFDAVVSTLGRLDILVNNAGIQAEAASEVVAIADVRRVLDVNLLGSVNCSLAAIRHFLSRPGAGVIVNCSSFHEVVPKPHSLAIDQQRRSWQHDANAGAGMDRGIRVICRAGANRTPINIVRIDDLHRERGRSAYSDIVCSAEEIAAVFAFGPGRGVPHHGPDRLACVAASRHLAISSRTGRRRALSAMTKCCHMRRSIRHSAASANRLGSRWRLPESSVICFAAYFLFSESAVSGDGKAPPRRSGQKPTR
jgi:glucose 1-dehydrogenase